MATLAIIGAGAVGSTLAYTATLKNLFSEILLIDQSNAKEEGETMDIGDALSTVDTGSIRPADLKDAKTADVIVVTAGAPQKPGETRLDLVQKNAAIQKNIFHTIGSLRKDAIVMIIANPVDVLTMLVQRLTNLPPTQVFGTGTSLDTARLKTHVARLCDVSAHNVHGYVLGEHGDTEFIAWSTITVGGLPANKIKQLTENKRKGIADVVKKEAYAIIERKGATFYGIAAVAADILEAIVFDQKKIFPVSTLPLCEIRRPKFCLGYPAVIGKNGVERLWPLSLGREEKQKLMASGKTLQRSLRQIQ